MTIGSDLVGIALRPLETHVSWRATTNYAAAVGDTNPRYLDDRTPDGLVAPPLFATALTWPLLSHLREVGDLELRPEYLLSMVHYSETVTIHRLVRPDDTLALAGEIVAVLPHRAGTHLVIRVDALDDHRKPVFTEHVGALFRGVPCADAGAGADALPELPVPRDGRAVVWEAPVAILPEAPWVYDGCTGIEFMIHTSHSFSRQVGLPGPIVQGTLTLALALRELVDREGGGDPERVACIGGRFGDLVLPGTTIRVQVLEIAPDAQGSDLHFRVLTQGGGEAIRRGYLRLRL